MSLKSVELQIAIPRTQEAGTMQNQLQHKRVIDQAQLANHAIKTTEKSRVRNAKLNEAANAQIRREEDKPDSRHGQQPSRQREQADHPDESGKKAEHPYKGQHIDISL